MKMKVIVTGANGGFGALTVKTLVEQGHTVAASMRDIHGRNAEHTSNFEALGAHVVEIDVTNEESVNAGVKDAYDKMGGLDAVVNNAGVGVLGFQELFTTKEFERLFDINVFGVQRVNRAAIPYLRKQGSGLLIQISSILGRMNLPFYSPYNASKWAVEALAEGYRLELSAFGIESVIVEPGGFPTSFFDRLIMPSDEERGADYGPMKDAPKQMFEAFEGALADNKAQDPQLVADAVADLLGQNAGERPVRTVVDKMGMGDHMGPYNDQLEQIHHGILGAFGMGDMLKVKTKVEA